MRNFYLGLGVALLFGGAGPARGANPAPALGMGGARTGTANNTAGTNNNAAATNNNAAATNNNAANLPPPPPSSITTPPAEQGVPPTPAPAFPGLPSPPASPATPGSTGLPNQTTNDLRQTQNTSGPVDVASVQTALANGGFYKGPIDGTLAGPTRASVRAFQAANALPPTGQLDPQTIAALGVNAFAPAAQAPSGLAGAASPNANGNAASTTTNGIGANSSLNTAGGLTANPTPTTTGAGTPTVPSPGVTGGTGTTQRTTTSEPFPLSVPRPAPFQSSPIFIQP